MCKSRMWIIKQKRPSPRRCTSNRARFWTATACTTMARPRVCRAGKTKPCMISEAWSGSMGHFFFQAEDGIRDLIVTGVQRVLFRSGHLVLGHEGIPVVQAARQNTEMASSDLIGYMLNQRTGCMGPAGEDAEQEAEDFAALLIYRLGRLPS